jgi:hypothetical protein
MWRVSGKILVENSEAKRMIAGVKCGHIPDMIWWP